MDAEEDGRVPSYLFRLDLTEQQAEEQEHDFRRTALLPWIRKKGLPDCTIEERGRALPGRRRPSGAELKEGAPAGSALWPAAKLWLDFVAGRWRERILEFRVTPIATGRKRFTLEGGSFMDLSPRPAALGK